MASIETIQTATEVVNSSAGLITAISNFITLAIGSVLSTIGAAATIAKYMPPPDQPGTLSKVHKIINRLGQNAGHAANANQSE